MKMKEYLIDKKTALKDAMKILNSLKPKILFVEENGKLIGALTDGDVRRYLMSGGNVDSLVEEACNKKLKRIAHSKKEAEKMLSSGFIAIPIIDDDDTIIDIYVGEQLRQSRKKKINIPVVINAGGKGTRLDPFTKVLPKPLIPVGDLPIIEHIMHRYEDAGCEDFHIIVNYKKELIKSYFKEIEKEYKVSWVNENEPLGTGGGLSLLRNKLKETFFFICCDSLILCDYSDIVNYHRKNNCDITMICAKKKVMIPYGIVNTDDHSFLESIEEKPEFSFLTNTAMYVVEPSVLKDMKKNVRIDFPDFVKNEKEKGRKVGIYVLEEDQWLDMGQMSELEKMRIRLYGE